MRFQAFIYRQFCLITPEDVKYNWVAQVRHLSRLVDHEDIQNNLERNNLKLNKKYGNCLSFINFIRNALNF